MYTKEQGTETKFQEQGTKTKIANQQGTTTKMAQEHRNENPIQGLNNATVA